MSTQDTTKYYDEKYFTKQKSVGMANANNIIQWFEPHVSDNDVVLDFGCGGGYVLSALVCRIRHGFDVNQIALKKKKKQGLLTHSDLSEIESESLDVVISNSAIEHTPTPYEDICKLRSKLKPGGKIIFRVPHETIGWSYAQGDWNYHLFTWSPMALGNLFHAAGFSDISVVVDKELTPSFFQFIRNRFLRGFIGKAYRLLRMAADEMNVRRIGVDGYCVIVAKR